MAYVSRHTPAAWGIGSNNSAVVITGLAETRAALEKHNKDALKQMDKTMKKVLKEGRDSARYIALSASASETGAPLSGWKTTPPLSPRKSVRDGRGFPVWDVNEVVAGIKSTMRPGKVRGDYTTSAGALLNDSAPGRIFELAGRKDMTSKSKNGEIFKQALTNRFGKASRVVFRIVDRDGEKIRKEFFEAYDKAKAELQKGLESQNI
jgi:hypothetical protein